MPRINLLIRCATLLIAAFVGISAPAQAALTSGLISYYKMEGNSTDSVNGNNGTDTAITYSSGNGKILQGGGLNGTSSLINLGDPASLHLSAFSIGMWINPTSVSAPITLISKNASAAPWSSPYASVLIRVNSGSVFEADLSNGASLTSHTQALTTSTNTWQYIVFTYDGSVGTIYTNGFAWPTFTYSVTVGYTTDPWLIGADNGGTPRGDYFPGAIDEVGIWNRALSSSEVTQLYNSGTGLTYPFGVTSTSHIFTPAIP